MEGIITAGFSALFLAIIIYPIYRHFEKKKFLARLDKSKHEKFLEIFGKRTKKIEFLLIAGLVIVEFGGIALQKTNPPEKVKTEATKKKLPTNKTTTETKTTKEAVNYQEVNIRIAKYLEEDQGWAMGTLDNDGKPTETGTPNDDYAWSIYVRSIEFDKTGQLNISITSDFQEFPETEKTAIGNRAQGIAMAAMTDYKDMTPDEVQKGFYTTFTNGNYNYGHSRILNYKTFKWAKPQH
ncbi:hypothetical protein [Companilactobacillus mishanensis]|uniref:hypothetical protein n=1 Tax=Companilactobacillus mishanensis TaxID=2486008 RepID=UPI001294FC10|nr:hypothetical protein [Companilactobacillus mishanensis]MQS90089.1 hypothetical protein [Companilactobacillus mishanensis]